MNSLASPHPPADISDLLENLRVWFTDAPLERRSTLAVADIPDGASLSRDPRPVGTALALLAGAADDITREGDPILLETRRLLSGTDFTFRMRPNPAFFVTFRDAHEASYSQLTPAGVFSIAEGLAHFLLAQRLAIRHGMKVWLELESMQAQLHLYVADNPTGRTNDREQPMILIIEDVIDISALLSFYLTQAGYQTVRAHDGEQGLTMALEHRPDLITLDVMMPQKDGWEVLSELKTNPVTRPIPVVLISVLKDRQVGFEHGAADYLAKPVMRGDLLASVQRLLSSPTPPQLEVPRTPHHPVLVATPLQHEIGPLVSFNGTTVETADASSQEAMAALFSAERPPDLLIIDCASSYTHGISAAVRLRLFEPFDSIPIVAVCPSSAVAGLRQQSYGYIDAIVTPDQCMGDRILETLRETLRETLGA